MLSSRLLGEEPSGRLVGVPQVAAFTMAMAAALPFLLRLVEARVERGGRAPAPLAVPAE
jgi:hypothetical protein